MSSAMTSVFNVSSTETKQNRIITKIKSFQLLKEAEHLLKDHEDTELSSLLYNNFGCLYKRAALYNTALNFFT